MSASPSTKKRTAVRRFVWLLAVAVNRWVNRWLNRLAELAAAHDWVAAEDSPSGKCGWRCILCHTYTNAPAKTLYSPCDYLIRGVTYGS